MNFALFRFPNEDDIHLISSNRLIDVEKENISSKSGFILQPFNRNEESFLIPNDDYQLNPEFKNLGFNFLDDQNTSTAESEYLNYVSKSVNSIKKSKFQKVVPARIKVLNKSVNPIELFKKALNSYPNAFISCVSTQKFGTWIGATPEILLISNKEKIIETIALAGTQKSNGKLPSEAVWTQKEIEEQALVSRYIINRFKEIRLREFEEIGPKTVQAGDLLHLKTSYKINSKQLDYENLASTLVNILHPTSAVSGMPKVEALDFILSNERFDRELYSGYLGTVNFNNETQLYVNLRCCKVNQSSINLYAGAGVTENSVPEKEWIETENKCNIIERLIP